MRGECLIPEWVVTNTYGPEEVAIGSLIRVLSAVCRMKQWWS